MKNPLMEIGLTGGIGSGKSTVARIFETLGYQVYYADDRAKALYREDESVIESVKELFGKGIFSAEGELDRKRLAGIVFSDTNKLEQLNAIVHPATLRDFDRWKSNLLAGGYDKPLLFKEAAILFEAGSDRDLQAAISIYAPKNIRLDRVANRDGTNREQVLARMQHQWPDIRKIHHSDFVIYNDGRQAVIPQVLAAEAHFTAIASTHVHD
jgi:dephospho-CoA kinase